MIYKDTILIIDDTPDNIKVLYQFLVGVGFEVLIAEDGEEGIQVTKNAHPDLILLDVMMPGINGFEVCQILKEDKATCEIPIIFITALSQTSDKIKGFELGAADYVTKPFQQKEVLARITAHLTLRKQQRQLQRRNLELDAFAHTVAHDLKNPLSAIVNILGVFFEKDTLDPILNAEWRRGLHFVEKASLQALETIDALLKLAGVSRHPKVDVTSLEMSSLVERVMNQLLPMIEKYKAHIELPEQWPRAIGYSPWVEEIWSNYLSNALKYGGNPPCLKLGGTLQGDGMIRFWLRDNGQGLSQEAQAKLFVPFTRLHGGIEGHGLGLSIVHQIAEKLNGQVGVESEVGQGSTFYFILPSFNTSDGL